MEQGPDHVHDGVGEVFGPDRPAGWGYHLVAFEGEVLEFGAGQSMWWYVDDAGVDSGLGQFVDLLVPLRSLRGSRVQSRPASQTGCQRSAGTWMAGDLTLP